MSLIETDTAVALEPSNDAENNGHQDTAVNGQLAPDAIAWHAIDWDESAPRKLRRPRLDDDARDIADSLAKTLRPASKTSIDDVARGKLPHPARFLTAADTLSSDSKLAKRWCKNLSGATPSWKRAPSARLSRLSEECMLQFLANYSITGTLSASWGLISASSTLTDESLVHLWRELFQSSRRTVQESDDFAAPDHDCVPAECSQSMQMAELYVLIGLVFRHVVGTSQLALRGIEWATDLLEAATDSDGLPHGSWQAVMTPGVLSALRLVWLDAWWGEGKLLPKTFRRRLKRLLKQVVAMNAMREERDLVRWGLNALGTKPASPAVRSLSCDASQVRGNPAAHSALCSFGILRNHWGDRSDVCLISYADDDCRVAIETAGKSLASGNWPLHVSVAGRPVEFTEDWSLNCWSSDEDGDYLEIGRDAADVCHIRQFYLSRTDSFLYLADSIRAASGPVIYRSSLPLAAGWKAEQDGLTREFRLLNRIARLRAVPISLPQNVADGTNGRIEVIDGSLQFAADTPLAGVCSALLLEWSPSQRKAPVDWSLLTVAEAGRRLDSGEAFGARIRIGGEQLVFFHSHTSAQLARTVLGHHTPYETVIARFMNGNFLPVLNVEAEQGESE